MYFPKAFDIVRAIQLADMILQAYEQLEAFQSNTEWNLRGPYSLVSELRYFRPKTVQRQSIGPTLAEELHYLKTVKSVRGDGLPIGFVARDGHDAYLIFRGSVTRTEWVRDFNIHLSAYPYMKYGRVHDGFIKTYKAFRKHIHKGLDRIGRIRKLYIAGYSVGAAMATLAAPDVVSTTEFSNPIIYTFASPRIGDRVFADCYNNDFKDRSFRIANTCDLVTMMPYPVPFLKFIGGYFTHVETPVDFTVQEESAEKNHDLETYVRALKEAETRRSLLRYFVRRRDHSKIQLTSLVRRNHA